MKIIEERSTEGKCNPLFDFCYIDGSHSWLVDGLAFFSRKIVKTEGMDTV